MQPLPLRLLSKLKATAANRYTEGPGTNATATADCTETQDSGSAGGLWSCEPPCAVSAAAPLRLPLSKPQRSGCTSTSTISARQAYPLLFGFIRCANGRCCSQAFVLGRDLNLADSLLQYQQMQKLFQVQHAFALGILLTFIYVSKFTFQVKQYGWWYRFSKCRT